MLLSGCATSGSPVALAPDLPDLPAHLEQDCVDPGVGPVNNVGDAVTVIGANRVYAACERKKHRDTKTFYRNVKAKYGNN